MKRRNLLVGLGGLVGAGSIVGTGAFSSITAERTVSIAVADDDQALLKLVPSDTVYGDLYASLNNGQLELDFDGNGRGDGLGTDSEYNFDDVFTITNQGTQPVYVWAEFDTSNFGNGTAWLYPGSGSQTQLNDGSNSVVQLAVGETLHVGVHIDTTGVDVQSGEYTLDATIHANANSPGSNTAPNPGDGPFAPTAPNDYVAYYPLDGDAEDEAGGNDGTIDGAGIASGQIGQALSFDGVDDYVNIPDDSVLDITDQLTLSAWVKPASSQDDYARIISREESGVGNRQYNLGIDANATDPRTVVDTTSSNSVAVSGMLSIADDEWHHVAMTFDSSDELRLYVDGTEADSSTVSSSLVSVPSPVKLGAPAHLPGKDHFDGHIDDVRIYNRALSATEITAIFNDV